MLAESISPGQFGWMAGISIVAGGVYLWPQYLVTYAGSQGIYSLVAMTGLALVFGTLQVATALNGRQPTYVKTTAQLMPFFGPVLVFPVIVALSLTLDGLTLLLYALMLHSFFYTHTPVYILELAIVLVAGWIAMRTLSAVARSVQFWFPIILLVLAVILGLTAPFIRFPLALTPPADFHVDPWLNTMVGCWYLYSNAAVVTTLAPHVKWPTPVQASLTVALAILGQSLVLFALYAIALLTLGADAVSRLYWPLTYIFSLVSVRLFFVKGLGIFALMFWTSTVVLYLAVREFSWSWNISTLLSTSWPSKRTVVLALLLVLVAMVGMAIPSDTAARTLLFQWVSPLLLLCEGTSIPLMWICSRRKRQPG